MSLLLPYKVLLPRAILNGIPNKLDDQLLELQYAHVDSLMAAHTSAYIT